MAEQSKALQGGDVAITKKMQLDLHSNDSK